MSRRRTTSPSAPRRPGRGRIYLTVDEVETLARVANHYERAMGPMRHLVRLTASAEVRAKYRFVTEESKWLRRFAESTVDEMLTERVSGAAVSFTPRALVAFWGRLLSSLNSRRSRRRLSSEDVRKRESLSDKLEEAVRSLERQHPDILAEELATRRPIEAGWMRARLHGDEISAAADAGDDGERRPPS